MTASTIHLAIFALVLAATLGVTSSSTQAQATTAPAYSPKIRVLILDGFSNHNWPLNTRLLRGLLQPTGRFDVKVSTCPAPNAADWAAWRPDFAHTDVVIQTCNDIRQRNILKWPDEVKTAFVDFVRNGGGVLIYHSANNAFADWPEYNDILGLGWRPASYGTALKMNQDGAITRIPPGEGHSTNHAPRADVLVHKLGDHPIHEGFPKSWMSPKLEVYTHARGPAKNVEVLSYGQDPRDKDCWPLEWTVTYGQGRVYASSFGHVWSDESETTQPVNLLAVDEQILIQRAIQWLAKKPITVPVPKIFPTSQAVSLTGNVELPKE